MRVRVREGGLKDESWVSGLRNWVNGGAICGDKKTGDMTLGMEPREPRSSLGSVQFELPV